MFCHMVERDEIEDQTGLVLKNEHFVAMEVFASATPFATYIFPLRHMASLGEISELEILDLGRILRSHLAKIYVGLENPDLNFTIRSSPAEYAGARHFHYVRVIPPADACGRVRTGLGDVHQHRAAGGRGGVSAEGCDRQDGGWGREVRHSDAQSQAIRRFRNRCSPRPVACNHHSERSEEPLSATVVLK